MEFPLAQPVPAAWLVVDVCTFLHYAYEPTFGLKGLTRSGVEIAIAKNMKVSPANFQQITLFRSQDPNVQSNIKGVIGITVEDEDGNATEMQFAVNTQCYRIVEMYCVTNKISEKPGDMQLFKGKKTVQKTRTLQAQRIQDGDVLTIVVEHRKTMSKVDTRDIMDEYLRELQSKTMPHKAKFDDRESLPAPKKQQPKPVPQMVTVATVDDRKCGEEYQIRKLTGMDLLHEVTGESTGEIWVLDAYGNCGAKVPLNEPFDELGLGGFSVAIKSC